MSKEGFWDNPDKQRDILKERALLSETVERFDRLSSDLEDVAILLEMALEEEDHQELSEISRKLESIEAEISAQEFQRMLGGADDRLDAIVSINAGAGGTDERRGFERAHVHHQQVGRSDVSGGAVQHDVAADSRQPHGAVQVQHAGLVHVGADEETVGAQ